MLNKEVYEAQFLDALRDTLETMAFAEVFPDDGENNAEIYSEGEFVWGKVDIKGSGDLIAAELAMPKSLAAEMADTMYSGMIPDPSNAVLDTTAELTNTLTGRFLLNLGKLAGNFTLSVPTTGEGLPELTNGGIVCQCIVDETHRVRAILFTNE